MNREKEAFLIIQILFYLQVEILHHGYLVLTAALFKRLHLRFTDIPSPYRRVITSLSLHYQRLPSRITFRRTDHLKRIVTTDQSVRLNVIRHGNPLIPVNPVIIFKILTTLIIIFNRPSLIQKLSKHNYVIILYIFFLNLKKILNEYLYNTNLLHKVINP